jgi:hypothetical protein
LCRYNFGGHYCAHRMVGARTCVGEQQCLERSAPSYHSRGYDLGNRTQVRVIAPVIDLRTIDLGAPLEVGRR